MRTIRRILALWKVVSTGLVETFFPTFLALFNHGRRNPDAVWLPPDTYGLVQDMVSVYLELAKVYWRTDQPNTALEVYSKGPYATEF